MEKIKSIIWDSGNAVTLIENCGSEDLLDFDLVNKIDDFDSSLYNEVRNRKITKNEVLEYLETL